MIEKGFVDILEIGNQAHNVCVSRLQLHDVFV